VSGSAGVGASTAGTSGGVGTAGSTMEGPGGSMGTAGVTGTAGATGAAGASTGGQGSGVAGAGGGAAGASGTAGSAGAGSAGASADGGALTDGGSTVGPDGGTHGNKILIYTKATGFVHASTPVAAAQITKAAAAVGLVAETSADPTKFTPAGLAPYAVIVLLATTGEPFGSPGTMQVQTLIDWVHAGGGLVAIENADHAYDSNVAYVQLIGGDFNGHSAGTDTCTVDGVHPTTMHLPATFMVTDEIYYTLMFRVDNQVVLRCGADKRPIAWVRQEGGGRVFYEALGHNDAEWTSPPLVDGLVLPGILWSMGRAVP